jgi:hypothetical protein
MKKIQLAYVKTNRGRILVQRPANNQWGFELCDHDQSWPGGFDVARTWRVLSESKVPQRDLDRLGELSEYA